LRVEDGGYAIELGINYPKILKGDTLGEGKMIFLK
jgi:hypothetical protein